MNNFILTSAKALYVTLATMVILFLSSCSGQQLKSWPERENYFMQLIDEGDIDTANELLKEWLTEDLTAYNYDFPLLRDNSGFQKTMSPDMKICMFTWDTQQNGFPIIWDNLMYIECDKQIYVLSDNNLTIDERNNQVLGTDYWNTWISTIRQVKDMNGQILYIIESAFADSHWATSSINVVTIKDGKLYRVPEMFITKEGTIQDELWVEYNYQNWHTTKTGIIDQGTMFLYGDKADEILMPIVTDDIWPTDRYQRLVFNGSKFIFTEEVPDRHLHSSLHQYMNLEGLFLTKKHLIRIDRMEDGNLRYASWRRTGISREELSMNGEPELVLNNGEEDEDGNYLFCNGSYVYKVCPNHEDNYLLEVSKHGKVIARDNQVTR